MVYTLHPLHHQAHPRQVHPPTAQPRRGTTDATTTKEALLSQILRTSSWPTVLTRLHRRERNPTLCLLLATMVDLLLRDNRTTTDAFDHKAAQTFTRLQMVRDCNGRRQKIFLRFPSTLVRCTTSHRVSGTFDRSQHPLLFPVSRKQLIRSRTKSSALPQLLLGLLLILRVQ